MGGGALIVTQAPARPAEFDLPDALDHQRAVMAMRPAMKRHAHPQCHGLTAWQQKAVLAKIIEPTILFSGR
ncbi:hypothetical protein GCM10011349_11780 [Novosphingobium indicum]|uniref:Uncharacterized protein n=1 Tax=Novosphingobium indicum TaxID=462949 RepID=A0ABQ2JI19_9SPHN|nr:hypothetical protein GCM10011349_11780 [Novosphingobium indicum]